MRRCGFVLLVEKTHQVGNRKRRAGCPRSFNAAAGAAHQRSEGGSGWQFLTQLVAEVLGSIGESGMIVQAAAAGIAGQNVDVPAAPVEAADSGGVCRAVEVGGDAASEQGDAPTRVACHGVPARVRGRNANA